MGEPKKHPCFLPTGQGPRLREVCALGVHLLSHDDKNHTLACSPAKASFSLHAPIVPGSRAPEAPGREARTRAGGDPKSHRGKQQLHQDGKGKTGPEDGIQQGEPGGPPCRHVGTAAREGKRSRIGEETPRTRSSFHGKYNGHAYHSREQVASGRCGHISVRLDP